MAPALARMTATAQTVTTATPDDMSAPPAFDTSAPPTFDADRPWRLHDRVALRPEPFGALAYHYGNRRLTFLRSHDLVALVEQLAEQPSARAAFDAAGVEPRRWPSFEKALTSLAAGAFIVPAGVPDNTDTSLTTDDHEDSR